MLEDLSNAIKNLNGQKIKINMPLDKKRYFDRKCPNKECSKIFKIYFVDWKKIVKDEYVFCPICKTEKPSNEWNTFDQQNYINNKILGHVQKTVNLAMKDSANRFKYRQKTSFISFSVAYIPGKKIISIPPSVAKELEQFYKCDKCHCRYSYLGTAYFCPSCGNENVLGNVSEGIRNIENFINIYPKLKTAYSQVSNKNTESYLTQLTEEHYCKIVALFQKYSEYLFNNIPNYSSVKIRKNLFQNINESSLKWRELTHKGYEEIIEKPVLDKIKEHFQIRHLLSHTGGIIDEDFVKKTHNESYVIGKRIIIDVSYLSDFLINIKILMKKMQKEYKKIKNI